MPTNAPKIFVAEAIGTFTLIFVGVVTIYSNGLVQPQGQANLANIGLAHGLAIGVSMAALGAISGDHFNPAVTFGFVVTGRMKPLTGLLYWVAQLVGASIAGFIALAIVGQAGVAGGTPDLGKGVSDHSSALRWARERGTAAAD
jgi:aquaporin TIP